MALRPDFTFSQGSLQDFVDCPRRFELRHVMRVAWPALEAEPPGGLERELELGQAFHRLVHQHTLGIDAGVLLQTVDDLTLRTWWQAYLQSPPADLPTTRYPEQTLTAAVGGYRLVAKLDLLALEPSQRAVIVDWKTSRRVPGPGALAQRLQTRVYPYVVAEAGTSLNGGQPIAPDQVEMIYWFANEPDHPVRLPYNNAQYHEDAAYLRILIEHIAGLEEGAFYMTDQEERCAWCRYRSLCARGVAAGPEAAIEDLPTPEEQLTIAPDLEQIAEIEF